MSKKIIQLDLDGNFIKEWDNISSIVKDLGYSQGNISSVCLGNRRIANGYRWMFYDDYLNTKDFSLKERKTTSRKINQYSLDGTFIKTFDSIVMASKELNILGEKITMVCKGKRFQTGGYFWMYYENPENVEILEKIKRKEIKFNIFSKDNSLEKEYPTIAKKWDYERNGNILPSMVSSHSGVKYFFNCDKGHSFPCKVTHMVDSNVKCPICNKERKESIPEYVLYFYLRKYFKDIVHSFKSSWLGKKELDIFIPSLNIAIEYDGQAWHKNVDRDLEKNKLCRDNNVKLYRIREPKCTELNDTSIDLYLDGLKEEDLDKVILKLLDLLNIKNVEKEIINSKRDFLEIVNLFDLNCKKNSILVKSPILEKYWDYNKNGKVLPSFVSYNSHKEFYWKCPYCSNEWAGNVRKMYKRKIKCLNCKDTT